MNNYLFIRCLELCIACLLKTIISIILIAVSPDGKMCQSREPKEWHGCRATKGVQGHGNQFIVFSYYIPYIMVIHYISCIFSQYPSTKQLFSFVI